MVKSGWVLEVVRLRTSGNPLSLVPVSWCCGQVEVPEWPLTFLFHQILRLDCPNSLGLSIASMLDLREQRHYPNLAAGVVQNDLLLAKPFGPRHLAMTGLRLCLLLLWLTVSRGLVIADNNKDRTGRL